MEYRTYARVGDKERLRSEHVVERRLPRFDVDVFFTTVIAFALATIAAIAYFEDYRTGFFAGALFALAFFLLRLRFVYDRVAINDAIDEYEDEDNEQELSSTDPLVVKIYQADGTPIMFRQPYTGAFAKYISEVIDDATNDSISFNNKVTLSQRQAIARRWPVELWRIMIDLFIELGWVRIGRNSVPEPTELGIGVWRAWLRMLPPTRVEYMN